MWSWYHCIVVTRAPGQCPGVSLRWWPENTAGAVWLVPTCDQISAMNLRQQCWAWLIWSNNVVDCQLGKYLISEEWRRAPVSSPVSPMSAPLQSLQCCDHCPLLFSSSSSATIVTVTYSHLSIADQTDFSEEHFNDREQMTSVQSQMLSFIHHENVTQTQNNLINTTQPWKKIFWWNSWKYYFYPK